ncbi:RDD family protein [Kocuria sp. NPDC057446]|uniref:RDD family protein n=1 Tax=Kocuria sp. NPDC057446 TaxID=3346137 RepID=UPI0036C89A87
MPLALVPRVSAKQRVAALLLDNLVILGWMALLAVGSLVPNALSGGDPDVLGVLGPVDAQAVFFLLLTLPAGLYLYFGESSSAQASSGKQRLGLMVRRIDGHRPSRGQVAIRTVVKLLPWEVAHTFVWQMQAVF